MTRNKYILTTIDKKNMNFAMRLSFFIGIFMLIIKTYACYITGSTAILSDAAESVIHIFAVGFAAYSMWLSLKPADANHLYGHEKINFFSAGFEGALIIIAAIYIYYESTSKIIFGVEIENLGAGIAFIIIATVVNLALGIFLLRRGHKYKSIILEANGKHILTDCWTSFAVIIALFLVKLTGILVLDPLIAMLAATNILWTGAKLIKKSVSGLMDQTDMTLHRKITAILNRETAKHHLEYHHLRDRLSGHTVFIEFHLLFPKDINLGAAHDIASHIESVLQTELETKVEIFTHLELQMHHDTVHQKYGLPI